MRRGIVSAELTCCPRQQMWGEAARPPSPETGRESGAQMALRVYLRCSVSFARNYTTCLQSRRALAVGGGHLSGSVIQFLRMGWMGPHRPLGQGPCCSWWTRGWKAVRVLPVNTWGDVLCGPLVAPLSPPLWSFLLPGVTGMGDGTLSRGGNGGWGAVLRLVPGRGTTPGHLAAVGARGRQGKVPQFLALPRGCWTCAETLAWATCSRWLGLCGAGARGSRASSGK